MKNLKIKLFTLCVLATIIVPKTPVLAATNSIESKNITQTTQAAQATVNWHLAMTTGTYVNLRFEPGMQSKILYCIPDKGTYGVVDLNSGADGWYYARFFDKTYNTMVYGYISKQYVKLAYS